VRVLMLSKACVAGIYQRKLEEMAARRSSLDLTLAVPASWRDERGITPLERVALQGYRLKVLPIAFNGSFHLHFYPTLARLLRDVAPDIVHIDEEPYNLATSHANYLARRQGAKTVWFSWQNLLRNYPPPFCWIEAYNLRHVDYALVGSRSAAQVWRAKGYQGPLAVIPQFGVDPVLFSPPLTQRADPELHIAYVGRLVPEKGVDTLLEALHGLPGSWHATVLGSGPEEHRLRDQCEALGLAQRIAFMPWLPSAAMPDFYRGIDVLVLPSRSRPNWIEQFGRVLVEAMASGVVVIGSNTGEIPHVVGEAGLIFPEADAVVLREHLRVLLLAPELRANLGTQGRARVLEHYTQQQIAESTVRVYEEMLR